MLLHALYIAVTFLQAHPEEKLLPNIVTILTDDLGFSDSGLGLFRSNELLFPPFSDKDRIITPKLIENARNGVVFTNSYVTAPQCSPSRAGLLTGLYPQKFGHESNTEFTKMLSNTSVRTIAEYLQPLGYRTAIFGKWNLGDIPNHPSRHGFNEVYLYRNYEEDSRAASFLKNSRNYSDVSKANTILNGSIKKKRNIHNLFIKDKHIFKREHATNFIFQKAIEFMGSRNQKGDNMSGVGKSMGDMPYFVYLAPMSPHPPLVYPSKYQTIYNQTRGLSARRKSYAMISELDDLIASITLHIESQYSPQAHACPWTRRSQAPALNETIPCRQTLLIFLNDNGGAAMSEQDLILRKYQSLNYPLRGYKGDLYEGGIHVPMFLRVFPSASVELPASPSLSERPSPFTSDHPAYPLKPLDPPVHGSEVWRRHGSNRRDSLLPLPLQWSVVEPVSSLDILPTILDYILYSSSTRALGASTQVPPSDVSTVIRQLLSSPSHPPLDGVSFLPLLAPYLESVAPIRLGPSPHPPRAQRDSWEGGARTQQFKSSAGGSHYSICAPIASSPTLQSTEPSATCAFQHRVLYWRFHYLNRTVQRAVRRGDLKWIRVGERDQELYNLTADISEKINLCRTQHPVCDSMRYLHQSWERTLIPYES